MLCYWCGSVSDQLGPSAFNKFDLVWFWYCCWLCKTVSQITYTVLVVKPCSVNQSINQSINQSLSSPSSTLSVCPSVCPLRAVAKTVSCRAELTLAGTSGHRAPGPISVKVEGLDEVPYFVPRSWSLFVNYWLIPKFWCSRQRIHKNIYLSCTAMPVKKM